MKRFILQVLLFPVLPVLLKGGKAPNNDHDPQVIASAEKAMQDYDLYVSTYRPVMKKFNQEMYFGPETEERVAGATNADIMRQQSAVMPKLDPSSGRVVAGLSAPQATSVASDSMVRARQGVKDLRVSGMEALAEVGRGGKSDIDATIGNLARDATNASIEANKTAIMNNNATTSAIGSMAGLGMYALTDKKKEA